MNFTLTHTTIIYNKIFYTILSGSKFYSGTVVSPSAPRTECGLYWGYSVRVAPSFGAVFTQSPYTDGYDVTIGTSESGTSVDELELPNFR